MAMLGFRLPFYFGNDEGRDLGWPSYLGNFFYNDVWDIGSLPGILVINC